MGVGSQGLGMSCEGGWAVNLSSSRACSGCTGGSSSLLLLQTGLYTLFRWLTGLSKHVSPPRDGRTLGGMPSSLWGERQQSPLPLIPVWTGTRKCIGEHRCHKGLCWQPEG